MLSLPKRVHLPPCSTPSIKTTITDTCPPAGTKADASKPTDEWIIRDSLGEDAYTGTDKTQTIKRRLINIESSSLLLHVCNESSQTLQIVVRCLIMSGIMPSRLRD